MRPSSVTDKDIKRWDFNIENDEYLPKDFGDDPNEREVLYASLWLCEQLMDLDCPDDDIVKIQYTTGRLSVENDTWEVHQAALDIYKDSLDDLTSELTTDELVSLN